MISGKYYFAGSTVLEYHCRNYEGCVCVAAVPTQMQRRSADRRTEAWTCDSERNATANPGYLDRILICDRSWRSEPVLCDVVRLTISGGGETVRLAARRDAGETDPAETRTTWPPGPLVLVLGNEIHAPSGHHLTCNDEHDYRFRTAPHSCAKCALDAGHGAVERTADKDDADIKRNVEVLKRMLATRERPTTTITNLDPKTIPLEYPIRYYFPNGVAERHWHAVDFSRATAMPLRVLRTSTDVKEVLMRNVLCETMSTVEVSDCLDRIVVLDRSVRGDSLMCDTFYLAIPNGAKTIVMTARRDANADAVFETFGLEGPARPLLFVSTAFACAPATLVHAPVGYHIACEDSLDFVRRSTSRDPALSVDFAKPARTIEEDVADTRRNAEIFWQVSASSSNALCKRSSPKTSTESPTTNQLPSVQSQPTTNQLPSVQSQPTTNETLQTVHASTSIEVATSAPESHVVDTSPETPAVDSSASNASVVDAPNPPVSDEPRQKPIELGASVRFQEYMIRREEARTERHLADKIRMDEDARRESEQHQDLVRQGEDIARVQKMIARIDIESTRNRLRCEEHNRRSEEARTNRRRTEKLRYKEERAREYAHYQEIVWLEESARRAEEVARLPSEIAREEVALARESERQDIETERVDKPRV